MVNPLSVREAVKNPATQDPELEGIPFASADVKRSYKRALKIYSDGLEQWELTGPQRAFIAAYRCTGTVAAAAAVAQISRVAHHRWTKDSPAYFEAYKTAEAEIADMLEAEAINRATRGWQEPVYQGGKLVGYIQKRSDRLLEFLLMGAKKAKFGKHMPVAADGGGASPSALDDLDSAISNSRARAAAQRNKMAAIGDDDED